MITKETFVKTMEELEDLDRRMNAADEALRKLNPDFCSFYVTDAFDIPMKLLESIFHDEENSWISYFTYERDWLRDFELGDIMINGIPVKIENWEDVYDFLIKNMEER